MFADVSCDIGGNIRAGNLFSLGGFSFAQVNGALSRSVDNVALLYGREGGAIDRLKMIKRLKVSGHYIMVLTHEVFRKRNKVGHP